MSHLRTQVFPSEYNLDLDERYRGVVPTTALAESSYRLQRKERFGPARVEYPSPTSKVVLTFAGSHGPVETYCHISGFLVDRENPAATNRQPLREGLFNTTYVKGLRGRSILGLVRTSCTACIPVTLLTFIQNFFQSMYVALQKPAQGTPYVQFAHRIGKTPNLLAGTED